MRVKSILVPFSGTKEEMPVLKAAYSIAKTDSAHIRVIYITSDTTDIFITPYEKSWMETTHSEQSKIALKRFEKFVSANHITVGLPDNIPANGVSASFTMIKGNFKDIVSYYGKLSDMIIIDRAIQEFGDTVRDPIMSAVMETGKGTLLLPPNKLFTLGDPVMIAWNGSLQATRAVNSALSILCHASKVFIITGGTIKKNLPDQAALASYLQMHGITARIVQIGDEDYNDNTATLFTKEAIKLNCKLIVMGAFTHSPLQQMVLGGITSIMLDSNNIPIFMAN